MRRLEGEIGYKHDVNDNRATSNEQLLLFRSKIRRVGTAHQCSRIETGFSVGIAHPARLIGFSVGIAHPTRLIVFRWALPTLQG